MLPDSITAVGTNAFGGCYELQRVILPENLSTIEDYTFDRCDKLERLYIPQRVLSIGRYALSADRSMEIYYSGSETQWGRVNKQTGNTAVSRAQMLYNALASSVN